MPVARKQLSTTMFNYGECPEAVILQLENPFMIIERSSPLQSEGARLARSTLRMVWESILALRPNVRFCSGSKSAKRQRRWHSGRELQRRLHKGRFENRLAPFSHSSPVVDIFDSRNYCWFPENVALAP